MGILPRESFPRRHYPDRVLGYLLSPTSVEHPCFNVLIETLPARFCNSVNAAAADPFLRYAALISASGAVLCVRSTSTNAAAAVSAAIPASNAKARPQP